MNVKLHKIGICMSKLAIYAMIVCQSLIMAMASGSEAQRKLLDEIPIFIENTSEYRSLTDVISEIESKGEFTFAYSKRDVREKVIKLDEHNWTMESLLKEISIQGRFAIRRVNETITLNPVGVQKLPDVDEQVELQLNVSGIITDENDQPLPGATVLEKGTTNGTVTDIDGKFSLTVSQDAILSVSFVGFEAIDLPVNGRNTINITLNSDVSSLDEVVVVGYGTIKKSDLTGSVASVSSEDFDKQPIVRLDQALQGRAAGVQVTQTSGQPGADFKIRIRGANSITGNNSPLYVVDGFVTSGVVLNTLNASDIESFEILKDASATAIYGSRGANGVVLITTRSGNKNRKSTIDFNTFHSFSNVVSELSVMNAPEYAEAVNFAEGSEIFTQDEIDDLRTNKPESWHDQLFSQAYTSNYLLSASGGNEKMDYYISGSVFSTEGTLASQNYDRYTLKANLNAQVTDRVKVGLRMNGSKTKLSGVNANLVWALTWDPTTPLYNEEGDYNYSPIHSGVGNGATNPLIETIENVNERNVDDVIANGFIDIELAKGLSLNILGGMQRTNTFVGRYSSILLTPGVATVQRFDLSRYMNTNRLTYELPGGGDHQFQVDAIHEQTHSPYAQSSETAEGFFSDNTTYKQLSLGQIRDVSNFSNDQSLQSFLGRVNYGYKGRYLLTASLRADGSSKFREGNRWGVFPSGSVAWRLSEERFIENITVIDNFKVRLSYGITGNQGVNPLSTREQPIINESVRYPFTGSTATIGVAPSNRLANPDLTWEETEQANAGVDIGLWKSKITLSVDVYKKHTYNLLLDRILPEFLGPTIVTENVGEVENKGFDISLGFTPVSNREWNVTSIFTLSRNKNKVLALVTDEPIELGNSGLTGGVALRPTRVEVGKPISTFRGYIFEGVYQIGEEAEAAQFGRSPGDAKYRDVNEDGVISTDDVVTVGNGNPEFTYGWNTTVSWKSLDLNLMFFGAYGNDIYNLQRARMMGLGSSTYHASHADYLDRWTDENPSNIPSGRDGVEMTSSQFIEDGSFFSLKNVSLSYSLINNGIINKIGLDKVRVYASIENAFILTKYTGYDPETTALGSSDIDVGIDTNAYPLSRTFTLGLNLTF